MVLSNADYISGLRRSTKFYYQYQSIKDEYNNFSQNTPYQIHPKAITASKPINTKQIAELVKNLQKSEQTSSKLTEVASKIKEIEKKIKEFKKPLDNDLAELIDQFVETKKKSLKNDENKQLRKEVGELKQQLKKLIGEKVDEIIRCCEDSIKLEQKNETRTIANSN
ncbi:1264_t:CDS:2 [Cetraspora pellucida]|uniref:1264_t:CDS:1 n=1 Tax=Cetraspora pellucida TaxID=1433469 RepID=A0ACA9MKX3_9GLOM|nr:1264_t:CDS:2 [Cetraspora pellucida]